MKWTLSEPKMGDIVRVKLGTIYHFGVYVSDEEVIQFGLPPTTLDRDNSTVKVCSTSVEEFMCGKFIEVCVPERHEKKKMVSRKKLVEIARSRIGEGGYHILYNNCEHFVNQCAFGEKTCGQVEDLKKMWKNYTALHVYIKQFPFKVKSKKIYQKERRKEIKSCKNKDVRAEKFYAWKLLEVALKESFEKDIKKCNITKVNGKPTSNEFEISISHSNDIVVVAVAKKPVGVDVEVIDNDRFAKFPLERILSSEEMNQKTNCSVDEINRFWTAKEAIFKKTGVGGFNPAHVNTLNEKYKTKKSYKVFKGKIDSIQRASGAKASLFPPENAVGSFVKIVQRIPVKIVFTEEINPEEYTIVSGMSVVPKVRVK